MGFLSALFFGFTPLPLLAEEVLEPDGLIFGRTSGGVVVVGGSAAVESLVSRWCCMYEKLQKQEAKITEHHDLDLAAESLPIAKTFQISLFAMT